jgi:hypothetical protein
MTANSMVRRCSSAALRGASAFAHVGLQSSKAALACGVQLAQSKLGLLTVVLLLAAQRLPAWVHLSQPAMA